MGILKSANNLADFKMLHSGGGMGRGWRRGSQRKEKSDNRDNFIKHGRWGCQQYSHFQYSSKYCVENKPERHLFQHTPRNYTCKKSTSFLTVLLAGRFKHFINNNWRSKYILNEIKPQNTVNRSASAAENTTGKKVLKKPGDFSESEDSGNVKKESEEFYRLHLSYKINYFWWERRMNWTVQRCT